DIVGKGLFSKREYAEGEFLIDYKGELISSEEGKKRYDSLSVKLGSFLFFFTCRKKKLCIDATFTKGLCRFGNDAGPGDRMENSEMRMVYSEKLKRPFLALFAKRQILKGEEIRYDYNDINLPWRKQTKVVKPCSVRLNHLKVSAHSSDEQEPNRCIYMDTNVDGEGNSQETKEDEETVGQDTEGEETFVEGGGVETYVEEERERKKTLRRPCPFCNKFFTRLTKHIIRKHGEEDVVKEATRLPKNLRDKQFDSLKCEGIRKYNMEVLKEEFSPSDLIKCRKPKDENKECVMCSKCKKFLIKDNMYKHKRHATLQAQTSLLNPFHQMS
ncbi:hypothetical protein FSP39_024330, partial [Pinctada imbricata]